MESGDLIWSPTTAIAWLTMVSFATKILYNSTIGLVLLQELLRKITIGSNPYKKSS